VLDVRTKKKNKKFRSKEMCNWIDCDVFFGGGSEKKRRRKLESASVGSSEGSNESGSVERGGGNGTGDGDGDGGLNGAECSAAAVDAKPVVERQGVLGQVCSKCRMVKYCSADHQRKDWEEHKRVCVRM